MADGDDILQSCGDSFWKGLEDLGRETTLMHGNHGLYSVGGWRKTCEQLLEHQCPGREAGPQLASQPCTRRVAGGMSIEIWQGGIFGSATGRKVALNPAQDAVVRHGLLKVDHGEWDWTSVVSILVVSFV